MAALRPVYCPNQSCQRLLMEIAVEGEGRATVRHRCKRCGTWVEVKCDKVALDTEAGDAPPKRPANESRGAPWPYTVAKPLHPHGGPSG